jgi:hypothetical protein
MVSVLRVAGSESGATVTSLLRELYGNTQDRTLLGGPLGPSGGARPMGEHSVSAWRVHARPVTKPTMEDTRMYIGGGIIGLILLILLILFLTGNL